MLKGLKVKEREKKKKENSTEPQKPNAQAKIYNNKTCDWGEKKFKSLVRFHSANKIDNYNRSGGEERKKNPKESTEQVKT